VTIGAEEFWRHGYRVCSDDANTAADRGVTDVMRMIAMSGGEKS